MMSIPSVRGFEMGDGFESCKHKGSEDWDLWNEDFTTKTNHCGGIQGGISNGMEIRFSVGFKPIASLLRSIPAIDTNGHINMVENKGRHDVCCLFRAVVIVEAMAALAVADMIKRSQLSKMK
jgi:chorismate synthase